MTTGILIIHAPSQLDEASNLVDLLEASLPLPTGAIFCSSLPGYAWPTRVTDSIAPPAQFSVALEAVGTAIAFIDETTVRDPQLCFDLAAAWARGKRIALLADRAERRGQLPSQLGGAELVRLSDRAALVNLVEDLAFDRGLCPRIGKEAQRAIEQLSSAPPPPETPVMAAAGFGSEAVDIGEPIAAALQSALVPSELATLEEIPADNEFDFGDPDQTPMLDVASIASSAKPSRELSLEAGRAISECSFHRDARSDLVAELEAPFGRFVDALGGDWRELRGLGDLDAWLAASDNLLDSLQPGDEYVSEWFEVGFQFSTLQSIAGQEKAQDPQQRIVYADLWNQSMAALRKAADAAGISAAESRQIQACLENLAGPEARRDYANVGRSLHTLQSLAQAADRAKR